MPAIPSAQPSAGRVLRTLKDGYWDRTEVIELSDGTRRVRKRNKGASAPGPWGTESLRREIHYLSSLPPEAARHLPRLLAAWDRSHDDIPDVGYEMPFFPHHTDAGQLASAGKLDQAEINRFQTQLAAAVLGDLHEPQNTEEALSIHLLNACHAAFEGLHQEPVFSRLIDAERIVLNGENQCGPRYALDRIFAQNIPSPALDESPQVRLHGDFFLENILWRSSDSKADESSPLLILVDPVSVAGVTTGPPVFDLVKYQSYARGELLALRSEWVEVAGLGPPGDDSPAGHYRFQVNWSEPRLAPFQDRNWYRIFHDAFIATHGPVNRVAYHLIDGYFSLAMALNTFGRQRQARLLKATHEFNQVLTLT